MRGGKVAKGLAERLKKDLNTRGAAFNDAPKFGDRFPFQQNYVERTFDYVASHFGTEFLSELKNIAPSEKHWNGPVRSTYGYHLVLITRRAEARLPLLDEIRSQVVDDWLRDQMEDTRSRAMSHLADQYKVEQKDLGGSISK